MNCIFLDVPSSCPFKTVVCCAVENKVFACGYSPGEPEELVVIDENGDIVGRPLGRKPTTLRDPEGEY